MGEGSAEKACSTVKIFGQSLKSALLDKDVRLCIDSKPKSRFLIILIISFNVSIFFSVECTTASLELVKKCLNGIEVDKKCLLKVYENMSEDKDCFCGGLLKFSEMLSSVEALLCAGDQGRAARLFFPGGGIFPNLFATTQAPTTATTAAPTTAPTAPSTTATTTVTTSAYTATITAAPTVTTASPTDTTAAPGVPSNADFCNKDQEHTMCKYPVSLILETQYTVPSNVYCPAQVPNSQSRGLGLTPKSYGPGVLW